MIRKIIQINEEKCNGCGICASACHEGAIGMVEGKAKLLREDYCDGLGDCLPVCPTDAIEFVEREVKEADPVDTRLTQWPVQIKLAPVNAPYFKDAHLLIAADCTAYSYAQFHEKFMWGRVTLVGCTKLDQIDYSEKLTEIIKQNEIRSLTIVKMEVPCCGGMERAVRAALANSKKDLPCEVITLSIHGQIL
ncbi:MAG: 4Fe-4S binding protein [Lachnospiraceae bacterium]|nr:4Fe-4S binding protein [Lachnospiraceae bacterium]